MDLVRSEVTRLTEEKNRHENRSKTLESQLSKRGLINSPMPDEDISSSYDLKQEVANLRKQNNEVC